MNLIDFTAADVNALAETGTVALRKLARELGLKGLSSARGEDIRTAIREAVAALHKAEAERRAEIAKLEIEITKKAIEQEIELAKADDLDPVEVLTAEALASVGYDAPKLSGRSRLGMVIVAKGTEIHKSETFRLAAEAAGWKVRVLGSVTDDEENERFIATATRDGGDEIELAWNGRAYDYPNSGATLFGKTRKVRNLKEALRLLVA